MGNGALPHGQATAPILDSAVPIISAASLLGANEQSLADPPYEVAGGRVVRPSVNRVRA